MVEKGKTSRTLSSGTVVIPNKVWDTTVSFDVGISSSVVKKPFDFRRVSKCCSALINERNFCSICQKQMGKEDTRRAIPLADDVIVISDENEAVIEAKTKAKSKEIIVSNVVKKSDLPPTLYTDKNYFLAVKEDEDKPTANKTNNEAYAMLVAGLEATNGVMLGSWWYRQKEHLIGISAYGGRLLMSDLFYPEQLKPIDKPETELTSEQMNAGTEFVRSMMKDTIDLTQFRNTELQLIEAILKGQPIADVDVKPKVEVKDAMAMFKPKIQAV